MLLPNGSFRKVFGSLTSEEHDQYRPNRSVDQFRGFAAFLLQSRSCVDCGHASPC
jgi:hypothetical protein